MPVVIYFFDFFFLCIWFIRSDRSLVPNWMICAGCNTILVWLLCGVKIWKSNDICWSLCFLLVFVCDDVRIPLTLTNLTRTPQKISSEREKNTDASCVLLLWICGCVCALIFTRDAFVRELQLYAMNYYMFVRVCFYFRSSSSNVAHVFEWFVRLCVENESMKFAWFSDFFFGFVIRK